MIALIVGSASFDAKQEVNALSCAIPPFTEAFDGHDLLLHGTLTDKQPTNQRGLVGQLTMLTFDAIKVYKGEQKDTFQIKADLSHDDFYRIGGDYVLFADKDDGNDGGIYLRDLCMSNYVSAKKITGFLDEYVSNPSVGEGIYDLHDVVGFPDLYALDAKIQTYIELNRGDKILERIKQEGLKNDDVDSCDFAKAIKDSPKSLLDHNGMVNHFVEENPAYEVMGGSINLDANPQTGKITYVGEDELLEVSAMNAEVIGNCFFVYNLKVIDKNTNKVQRNIDSQEIICMAENSRELFPDFCPNKSQKFPKIVEDNDSILTTSSYGHEWILKIILLSSVLIGISVGTIVGVKAWRKRK